ncbi:MAG: tRNA pseudouridine(38-40) synthase TruA [Cryomorphaceae bacterium]|nr:tRNA pseudouridine(38-40) synthase TruA [Cryomorphaceae bacterium]
MTDITQRYFMHFAYHGGNYHGWQFQKNAHSVQAELESALQTILRTEIRLVGAGRTDSGVHARTMYAHFDEKEITNTQKLTHQLNALLPNDVSVFSIKPVKPDAHCRFDAISRTYHYRLHFGKNPFLQGLSYRHYSKLDYDAMNRAALLLHGQKNFRAFEKSRAQENTGICNVTEAEWKIVEDEWVFVITANRFLRNMVRAIVGTLLDVGMNKIQPEDVKTIIDSQNRTHAGTSVPAHGLYLVKVIYMDDIFI